MLALTPENFTPAAGRTFEDAAAEARKLARANARKPAVPEPPHYCERARPNSQGRLVCPCCMVEVEIRAWWTHLCERDRRPDIYGPMTYAECMALPDEATHAPRAPRARKPRPLARKKWNGDPPVACQVCRQPIRFGFTDGKYRDKGWAIMCPMCSLQHATMGQRYERTRRSSTFYKIGEVD